MTTFTKVHVLISLIGIVAGFVVTFGLLTAKRLDEWTALFLLMTLLTSVTGFFFPFHGFTPAIVVGFVSLAVLAIAIFARYGGKLHRAWRWIYVGPVCRRTGCGRLAARTAAVSVGNQPAWGFRSGRRSGWQYQTRGISSW
jgi:hypothetical protein